MSSVSPLRRRGALLSPEREGEADVMRFVDRYRLVERIGRGGMGEVWEAVDEELGRTVALKLLHPHLVVVPENRARFVREMKAVAMIEHPNVARLYGSGVEPQPYMVMERVQGITLRRLMREGGPVEPDLAVCYAIQMAEALGAAHRAKLVHRDVKPENVIIGHHGHVWLLDFGIAHDAARGTSGEVTDRLGTLGYVTPEMVRGEPSEARSDFFQLGVVLYEMLSARKPWSGLEDATESEVQAAHALEEPDPIQEVVRACSEPLAEVIVKLLAKQPEERYADADEVARALRATLRTSGPPGHPAARAVRAELVRRKLGSLPGAGYEMDRLTGAGEGPGAEDATSGVPK